MLRCRCLRCGGVPLQGSSLCVADSVGKRRRALLGGACQAASHLAALSPLLVPPLCSLACSRAARGPLPCLHLATMRGAGAAPAGRPPGSQLSNHPRPAQHVEHHAAAPVAPLRPACPLLIWPSYPGIEAAKQQGGQWGGAGGGQPWWCGGSRAGWPEGPARPPSQAANTEQCATFMTLAVVAFF